MHKIPYKTVRYSEKNFKNREANFSWFKNVCSKPQDCW